MSSDPSDTGAPPPTLRQEVIILMRRRPFGWFVALYTVACVAAGFALGAVAFHEDEVEQVCPARPVPIPTMRPDDQKALDRMPGSEHLHRRNARGPMRDLLYRPDDWRDPR